MKAGREHRVPLSTDAIALVKTLLDASGSEFVFPGQKKGQPLSSLAMLLLLKRMKRHDLTVHGFRSTFKDWARETTNYPNENGGAVCLAVGDARRGFHGVVHI
jgi:integrase